MNGLTDSGTDVEQVNLLPQRSQHRAEEPPTPLQSKALYVMPDTNAFLNHLNCIEQSLRRGDKIIYHVPFVVTLELKRQCESMLYPEVIRKKAQYSVRFINEANESWPNKFQLQFPEDDCSHNIYINEYDDRIVSCTIKLKNRGNTVIVLTEDIGLSVKLRACYVNILNAKSVDKVPLHTFPLQYPD